MFENLAKYQYFLIDFWKIFCIICSASLAEILTTLCFRKIRCLLSKHLSKMEASAFFGNKNAQELLVENEKIQEVLINDGSYKKVEKNTPVGTHAESRSIQSKENICVKEHLFNQCKLLRILPLTVTYLFLELLPLFLFAYVAAFASLYLTDGRSAVNTIVDLLIDAYILFRLMIGFANFLFPYSIPSFRIVDISDKVTERILYCTMILAGVAAIGQISIEIEQAYKMSPRIIAILLRLFGVSLHVALFIFLIKKRDIVKAYVHSLGKGHLMNSISWRVWIWVYLCSCLLILVCLFFLLWIDEGVQELLYLMVLISSVIAFAQIVKILLLGFLAYVFRRRIKVLKCVHINSTEQRLVRYYLLARRSILLLVWIGSIMLLFEALGIPVIKWIINYGMFGRRLISVTLTISTAVLLSGIFWKSVNIFIDRCLYKWCEVGDPMRVSRLRTLLPIFRALLFAGIVLLMSLTTLNQIGVNTTPLLAGASLIGVALSLGSQNLIKDFMTGIFLLIEDAMQVGDWVTIAGVSGNVERLSIRTVRLRARDGSLYTIPFSSVTTVNNVNRGIGNAAVHVNIEFNQDIDQVCVELHNIVVEMRSDPKYKNLILNDLELWGIDAVNGAMITLTGQIQTRDSGRWNVQREFNRRMYERLRLIGIKIYNPDQRVIVNGHVHNKN